MAFSASLSVVHLPRARIFAALATVAEVALSYGVVAHVEPLDAVWLDVSGVAHLFGGEEALLAEIEERVSTLGFRARVGIADGPRIAEALARHETRGASRTDRIAAPGKGAEALAPLSLGALPLGDEARSLFVRLGVFTVGDFARLPRAQVVSRLSSSKSSAARRNARAAEVMALAMGHDPLPLEPYRAPEILTEETSFDDGIETASQLLFVLRGMVSRLSARLIGRAQATNRIEMTIAYDRSIFRLRSAGKAQLLSNVGASPSSPDGVSRSSSSAEALPNASATMPELVTVVDLPAPLSNEGDLLRAFKAKLEQIELAAPAVGLRLELSRVVTAPRVQLDLSRDVTVSPDALPALLSELSAEIGASSLGVLSIANSLRPEARSLLVPVSEGEARGRKATRETSLDTSRDLELSSASDEPLRLLPEPVSIGSLGEGESLVNVPIFIGHEPFEIARIVFDRRLDGVEWWASQSASRDYLRVLVTSRSTEPRSRAGQAASRDSEPKELVAEAWIYVDRRTGESYLQGWWE